MKTKRVILCTLLSSLIISAVGCDSLISPLDSSADSTSQSTEETTADDKQEKADTETANGKPSDETAAIVGSAENNKVDIIAFLEDMLMSYNVDPYNYIPKNMRASSPSHTVSRSDVTVDFDSFVSTDKITSQGVGQQWNMVLSNIEQSEMFFTALSAVETVVSNSVVAFNNYLDKNPSDTAQYSFRDGIYSVYIDFDGQNLQYALDYTVTVDGVSGSSAQILLSMNIESGERRVRVQLGGANALCYTLTNSSYSFAIKYAGIRRAYFSVKRDSDSNVSGRIFECLTVGEAEISSAADFYITPEYTITVGNKADGMLAFDGHIVEVYASSTGKLIGYEVEEAMSALTYNTLWLDLCHIDGITSVRAEKSDDSDFVFYVNNSESEFKSKKVGGLSGKMFSRRFDIEFRTQYFYVYDENLDEYTQTAVKVPMMFIQQEQLESFENDMKSENGINTSIDAVSNGISIITSSYSELLPKFKENKASFDSDSIIQFIGSKAEFAEQEAEQTS